MEHTNDLPVVVAKRLWHIVRVTFFMVRKSISKRKLMVDLNMMMKRAKIVGKAIHNLMFHHPSSTSNCRSHDGHLFFSSAPHEYEFSCSNNPTFPFNLSKRKHYPSHVFPCAHEPPTHDDIVTVKKVLKMLNNEAASLTLLLGLLQSPLVRDMLYSELALPALPGFGRSPMVRQLRITDSPFPLRDVDGDSHVDEAAKEFIMKFYNDLRK